MSHYKLLQIILRGNYAGTDMVGGVQKLLTEDGLIVWKGK